MMSRRPIVGLPTDRCVVEQMATHQVQDEYITALRDGANALPLIIPSARTPLPYDELFGSLDGVMFTGAPSNVAAYLYGAEPRSGTLLDEERDCTALPMLREAIGRGVPVLCICRGIQELNVALGGTLHQAVHEIPGRLDHRKNENASLDAQYEPSHLIHISEEGLLGRLSGLREAMVNSLHDQGIDILASDLHVDAVASDGQIEAVSMPGAKTFVLGVQWHPEWCWSENPLSRAIFNAFGAALSEKN